MSRERLGFAVTMALLVGVGTLGWAFQLRPAVRIEADTLAAIPYQLDGWRGRDLPVEDAVESMLRADHNVLRVYLHPLGDVVWVYVGYYGTSRGGTPEHTPRQCYAAQGWEMESLGRVTVDSTRRLEVNEVRVEQGGDARLVHYWFRSYRRTGIASTLALHLDHVAGRLLDGRADGALVRLSTPLADGDVQSARLRLMAVARALEPEIEAHWPIEVSGR